MNRKFMNFAAVGIGILGLAGLNSCLKVDETYDLEKDFDMTITVGGDLSVPGSSTEKILLGDLLDLEEDGIIKAKDEGEYHLVQEGEKTNTTVSVPGVDIAMTDGFTEVNITKNVPSGGTGSIDISFDEAIEVKISENGITSDIKELKNAVTSCEETYMVFSKTGANITTTIQNGYKIIFPEYISVISGDKNWKEQGNELVLNNTAGLKITEETKVKFQITKVDFEKGGATFTHGEENNSKIDLIGKISLEGVIKASTTGGSGGNVTLKVDVESNNMSIVSVTGKVDPAVDINVDPITLEDIPEFLSDNNVILDLTDPQIFVTLTNPSPVAVEIKGKLTSKKEGQNDKSVEIPEFEVPGNVENHVVCINQIKEGTEKVNEGTEKEINYVKVDGLSSIIENIPEKIEMDVDANAVQEEVTIELNKDFTIETDYKIDTPLSFGPKTNITYTETIDGWEADLEDAEFKEVEVSMTAKNEIPLNIKLTADAIDVNGDKLENVKVDLDVDIKPGLLNNPVSQEITFTLATTDGTIKGLDGIKLNVIATSGENSGNESLNENHTIQFTNIKLKLVGGITMDLN